RHTRWPRDWSSDVCSSDLLDLDRTAGGFQRVARFERLAVHRHRATRNVHVAFALRRDLEASALGAVEKARVEQRILIHGHGAIEIGRASCRERGKVCGGGT